MALYDYQTSKRILVACDPSFYSLVMAAMRRADTVNLTKLRTAFPDVWRELDERYHAPGGFLPGDREQVHA